MSGVWEGDAFDLLPRMGAGSVDLILTSPSYWGLRSYGLTHKDGLMDLWLSEGNDRSAIPSYAWYRLNGGVLGLEPMPQWYVAHLAEIFLLGRACLVSGGSLWVNLGDTYFARWASIRESGRQGLAGKRTRRRTPSGGYLHDKQLLMLPARFAIAMQDLGWILRNDVIWAKPNVPPRPERDRLRLSHEHFLHFVKRQPSGRPRYYYDLDAVEDGALDVVSCPSMKGSDGHSATFPNRLVRPRILSCSPAGGLVLDPFCGTGRALVQAINASRRALGFELSPHHAETARRQVAAALVERSRLDAANRDPDSVNPSPNNNDLSRAGIVATEMRSG